MNVFECILFMGSQEMKLIFEVDNLLGIASYNNCILIKWNYNDVLISLLRL